MKLALSPSRIAILGYVNVRAHEVCRAVQLYEPRTWSETRKEMVDGRLVLAPPALEPHAEQHYQLDYVTRGVLAPGYVGATDLLTRATKSSQFATDTCIRREGIDPNTGTRDLEELAFEVVNEQSLSDITGRAQKLTARGVRRALLDRAAADRAVVRALYAKQEPTILEIEARARAQVARKAIEALCEVLEIPIGSERRVLLQGLDSARLEALVDRIRSERRWPSLLAQ